MHRTVFNQLNHSSQARDKLYSDVLKTDGSLLAMTSVEAGLSLDHLHLVYKIYTYTHTYFLICKFTPLTQDPLFIGTLHSGES